MKPAISKEEVKHFLAILYFIILFIMLFFLFNQKRIISKLEKNIYNYEKFEKGVKSVNFMELNNDCN